MRAEKLEERRKERIAKRRADAIAAKEEALAAKKAEEERIGRSYTRMCAQKLYRDQFLFQLKKRRKRNCEPRRRKRRSG